MDDTLVIGASLFWWYHSQSALERRSFLGRYQNWWVNGHTESTSGHRFCSKIGTWTHSEMGDWNPW
jgi:hypothetical protein